ncbi:helix-turn-helix domain-containing protein [Caballeronia glathei]|uniref:helix-turn-helix domain-containing protein n=2 Tax=Caballeronia glathei TaxID=60547 RepID=UPI0009DF05EF|nr:AraC family transcriptional regulator [Caballeronia glathei]
MSANCVSVYCAARIASKSDCESVPLLSCSLLTNATSASRFESPVGSPARMLADIRMSIAANALKNPSLGTESVAELVGYQSIAAFRRAFTPRMGVTPGAWRRSARPTA